MIDVYTDGLAEPNPGIGTYGYVVYEDGKRILERHGTVGYAVTNNYAEYSGLIEALRDLSRFADEEIVVHSDSKLLVYQMKGEWRVSKKAYRNRSVGSYVEKYLQAKELVEGFAALRFDWVPREMNQEADGLSRVAYAEALARRRDVR